MAVKDKVNSVNEAVMALATARERLCHAVEAAIPVGTRVRVHFGNHAIIGEVIDYGASWSEPEAVYVKNLVTGKTRRFSVGYNGWEFWGEEQAK